MIKDFLKTYFSYKMVWVNTLMLVINSLSIYSHVGYTAEFPTLPTSLFFLDAGLLLFYVIIVLEDLSKKYVPISKLQEIEDMIKKDKESSPVTNSPVTNY